MRLGYASMNDDIAVASMNSSAFASLSARAIRRFSPYNDQWGGKILSPYLGIGGNTFNEQYLWFQHPHSYTITGKVVKTQVGIP